MADDGTLPGMFGASDVCPLPEPAGAAPALPEGETAADPEADLLARLGRRRILMLRSGARSQGIPH